MFSNHSLWQKATAMVGCTVIGVVILTAMSVTFATDDRQTADKKDAKSPTKMSLELEINRPEGAARGYRKPYVAVWLADKDGFPVRTISLWLQQDAKGTRWLPDLRQWSRDDRMRKLVEDTDLVDGMSGATKAAGKYKLEWDGTDNMGVMVKPGEYTLMVEAAREHGTYQLIKEKVIFGDQDFKKSIAGNVEIKGVNIVYHARPADEK